MRKKIFMVLLFCVILIIFINNNICAQQTQPQKDVSLEIILSSEINASNYTKFLRVMNNNDVEGENDNLSLKVYFNLSHKNLSYNNQMEQTEQIKYWNMTKTINSYSESGFGTLVLLDGEYVLCVSFDALNFIDNISENNVVCKKLVVNVRNEKENISNETNMINMTNNITVNSTTNSSEINETDNSSQNSENSSRENDEKNNETELKCNCELKIETNKEIFLDGEKIEFKIIDCENFTKYSFPIEYWVEDKKGVVKQKINTTSKATKTYTPSIIEEEKHFVIKSRAEGCYAIYQKLIVFTKDSEETVPFLKISSAEEEIVKKEKDEIIYVTIEGFKGSSSKTLISVWLEDEDDKKVSSTTKVYINEKNTNFNFKLPLLINVKDSGNYEIVAEGLDEKETEKIKIIVEEENKKESAEETNLKEKTTRENESKIVSFYTRKKVFEENITVYVSITFPENKTLIIRGEKEKITLENVSEKNNINISIIKEDEILLAELYDKGVLSEYKELKLNLTRENISNKSNSSIFVKNKEENKGSSKNNTRNVSQNLMAIYTSRNLSAQDVTNDEDFENNLNSNKITGQITAIELSKSGVIFILLAICSGLIIFNKRIRLALLKKTRSLKFLAFFNKKTKSHGSSLFSEKKTKIFK